jgi:flagellar biosynthetic protein FliR
MFAEHQVAGFLVVFARVGAWSYAAPLLGDRMVPAKVRVILIGAVALLLAPVRPAVTFSLLILAVPFEIGFGLALGAAQRFVLAGAEAGGQIIGIQMGLGFAGTFDPILRESSLPTRRIAFAFAALAFIAVGGFDEAIRALALPFSAMEAGVAPAQAMLTVTGDLLGAAVRVSAPMLIAGFVANLAMALISKAAPALNIFSVMLALFLGVGLVILVATAPAFIRDLSVIATVAKQVVWEVVP